MTHRVDRIEEALELGRAGKSASARARQVAVPRETVRDWLAGRLPRTAAPGARGCEQCGGAAHSYDALPKEYVYLLGLYLGDGCISRHRREVYRLRVTLDTKYPAIIGECMHAMVALLPDRQRVSTVARTGCCDVSAYWKGWPCLLPQHGPGKKHERTIELEPWQEALVDRDPGVLLRGLIHSDGCRFMNTGTNWRSPRYSFSNQSADIRRIFCEACARLDLRWTTCPHTVYVSRKDDVATLDHFVGPKS